MKIFFHDLYSSHLSLKEFIDSTNRYEVNDGTLAVEIDENISLDGLKVEMLVHKSGKVTYCSVGKE